MKKTFEISYKLRYYETDEWGTECLKTATKKQALIILRRHEKFGLKNSKVLKIGRGRRECGWHSSKI